MGSTENIKEGNEEIRQVGEIQTLMKHIKNYFLCNHVTVSTKLTVIMQT